MFPNPLTAESVVEFTLATSGPVEQHLTDLLGRPVGLAAPACKPCPCRRTAAGIYLVELRTANGRSASKVVIP
ncbi:hypothetical protein GCM10028824_06640 [Hymenobacter segetis]|uniref:T9SS type A sorting domain-containing protein n=1 Tax=Hymenobacter segetis TaxID=2025509 RepID=A0ABU9M0Y8_9BACT